jgi:hypothetical protein
VIVEAKQTKTIDVVIDPMKVLIQMWYEWRESIGVPRNSPVFGGYWMESTGPEGAEVWSRLRLASREEILTFEAFKQLLDVSAKLY